MLKSLPRSSWRWLLVGALIALLAVAVTACGDDDDDDDDGTPTDSPSATATDAPADDGVDALAAMFFPESAS